MQLVASDGAVVADDHAIAPGVECEIERIPEPCGVAPHSPVRRQLKDLSRVPRFESGQLTGAVVADADEDRSVRRHGGIATVMLGRRAAFGEVDVGSEAVDHTLGAAAEIDERDHIVGLVRRRVVDGGGVVVDESHAQEPGVALSNGRDGGDGDAVRADEAIDRPARDRVVERPARVSGDGRNEAFRVRKLLDPEARKRSACGGESDEGKGEDEGGKLHYQPRQGRTTPTRRKKGNKVGTRQVNGVLDGKSVGNDNPPLFSRPHHTLSRGGAVW